MEEKIFKNILNQMSLAHLVNENSMNDLNKADLSAVSNDVQVTASNLVELKYSLDRAARTRPKDLTPDLHGPMGSGEYGPLFGSSFLSSIIPFLPSNLSHMPFQPMLVPTKHVFGCSWRWWPEHLDPKDEENVQKHIFSEHGLARTGYFFYPELGLFTAGEGKNRVNYCRERGINWIPADVAINHYPSAERIKLIVMEIAGGIDVWAVCDDRYLQKVTHYGYAMPLLKAYGVSILDKWPKHLPPLDYVLQTSSELGYEKKIFMKPVIDLQKAGKAKEHFQAGEKYVRTSLININLQNRLWIVLYTGLALIAGAIMSSINNEIISLLGYLLISFSAGVYAVLCAPVFTVKRKWMESWK